MTASTWDDAGDPGFAAENVSKHDEGADAYGNGAEDGGHGGDAADVECRTCHATGHFARDCPDKPEGSGQCYNCGEEGHNKADCEAPAKVTCKLCKEEGHTVEECEVNRMHKSFVEMNIKDLPAEEAWVNLEKADQSRDIDDFKVALFTYAKAFPALKLEELEKAIREADFNIFLVAKQQEISDTQTIVNFQGEAGKEFVVSFQFSQKPRRKTMAEGWPSSTEENTERLANGGFVMDALVDKCRNCDQLGHLSNACPEDKEESKGKVVTTCSNCEEQGHFARYCPAPRKVNRNGCKNCGSFEHFQKDCTEERSAEGVECKNCNEVGHFSKDCPSRVEQACFNCHQTGHRKPDCPNERVIKCKNCDGLGHMSRECDKPTDWSRVQCNNCKEMGHTVKRCKNPTKVEDDAGDAGGSGGFDEPASASGGGGGGWGNDGDAASASGGGGGGWGNDGDAASAAPDAGGWGAEETPAAGGW